MEWPKNVHVESALQDGRRPEDFRYDQWSVSNVYLHQPQYTTPREVSLTYRASVPADTPLEARGGMALQSVRFMLRDADTGEILDVDSRSHTDGEVRGFLSGPCELWNRLYPDGPSVRVRLSAFPRFYFLNESGGMEGYSTIDYGHFRGNEVQSPVPYVLQMLTDGSILVDGQARPRPPEPKHEGLEEYERLIAQEEAERQRIERELQERLAREQAEREARWAREDAERERERKQAEAAAKAERKRNAPYTQPNRPEETVMERVNQLQETYDYHLKGMAGGDERWKDYLTSLASNKDKTIAEAARYLAKQRGWVV